MRLKWHGHSCFSMTFEGGATVVTDPFDRTVGYPLCRARSDIALVSHDHFDHNH
ncbi:MAG: MBL fold metallo-hydrolase, partial [Clostridiales bacterium]|nr:MBL fold metallo-hydrolase [Clostridiales bacterium]